jgi:hypothetical protein
MRNHSATPDSSTPFDGDGGRPRDAVDDQAGYEATQGHAPAERDHVDAHHAAAHVVGRYELDQRRDNENTTISAAPVTTSSA